MNFSINPCVTTVPKDRNNILCAVWTLSHAAWSLIVTIASIVGWVACYSLSIVAGTLVIFMALQIAVALFEAPATVRDDIAGWLLFTTIVAQLALLVFTGTSEDLLANFSAVNHAGASLVFWTMVAIAADLCAVLVWAADKATGGPLKKMFAPGSRDSELDGEAQVGEKKS